MLKCKELILHLIFKIKLLGGIESPLYANEPVIRMLHKVIDSRIFKFTIDTNIRPFNTVCGKVYSIIGEHGLMFKFVCEHKTT